MGETFKEKFNTQAIKYSITSSETEQVATKAERESEKVKMCEYMEKHIGEEYDGIVSSITNFGMFVELPNLVEGLIRVDSLQGDFYTFDADAFTLRGKKDKRGFRLGDTVKVKVVNANKQTKTVDFELIERIN